MQARLLNILESEAPRLSHAFSDQEGTLAVSEGMVKARVKARVLVALDAQPKSRSFAYFLVKPAAWSLAAVIVCLCVGVLLMPRSVKPGASMATLRFQGLERTIGLETEALDLQQQFTLIDDQALSIEGQRIQTAPVRLVDGKRLLPVFHGKFVVKFNRDHSHQPMEFLVGNHRILVVGTIFGVILEKSAFQIAVLEGKIQITSPLKERMELETGQSLAVNLNGTKPMRKTAISGPEFENLFVSRQKAKKSAANRDRSHKIEVREIDEHEATELYKPK